MYPILSQILDSGIQDWDTLEARIISLPTEQKRGEGFEEFCHAFFTLHKDLYQAQNVWRGSDIPQHILQKLGTPTFQDRGIDGLLQHHDGTMTAYQAKFRSNRSDTPSQRELSTFYMISDRADFRLVISNVEDLPTIAKDRKDHGQILVNTFLELDPVFFDALWGYVCTQQPLFEPPPCPKPFQIEAIDAITQGLREHTRGQAILACGAGKTLIGKWVADRLGSQWILVLVPSLALVRQTLGEWHRANTQPFRYICICSDPTVDVLQEEDNWGIQTSELDVKVSTSAADLLTFSSQSPSVPHVVFATYHSGPVIVEALKDPNLQNFQFDLVICDEAHRIAGPLQGSFSHILDNTLIRAQKRLFMTATPRILTPKTSREETLEQPEICSMDDPFRFGPVLFRFPFGRAIQEGVICDYRIVVIGVTEAEIAQLVREGGIVQLEDAERWKAEHLAKQIALAKAITTYGIKKVFSFHNRVLAAAQFVDTHRPESFPSVLKKIDSNLNYLAGHISGEMPIGIRSKIMRQFSLSPLGVIANARCLGEGVNVPLVDGIFFADPRQSVVDIVQATGRALRRAPGKKDAAIIIPVLVQEEEDAEHILESSNFNTVWQVLSAMASQDDRLSATIANTRIKQGKGEFPVLGQKDEVLRQPFVDCQTILMGFPKHIPFSDYQQAFTLEVMEKVGERWHLRFGALQEYMRQWGGGEPSTESEYEGFKIGRWLQAQKKAYRKGLLPSDRTELLDSLGLQWESDLDDEERWEEYLNACKEFLETEGHLPSAGEEFCIDEPIATGCFRPVHGPILGPILAGGKSLKIGNWLTHQRRFYKQGKLLPDRVRKIEEVLGKIWEPQKVHWDKKFAAYKDYVEKTGKQPQKKTKHQGLAIGYWVTNTVRPRKEKLTAEWVKRFDDLGFEWNLRKVNNKIKVNTINKVNNKKQSEEQLLEYQKKSKLTAEWVKRLDKPDLWSLFIKQKSMGNDIYNPTKNHSATKSSDPIVASSAEIEWDLFYSFCKAYLFNYHKLPSSEVIFADKAIGSWLEKQVKDWKAGLLSPNHSKRMKDLHEMAALDFPKRGPTRND